MKGCLFILLSFCIIAFSLKADFLEVERQKAVKAKQLILLSVEKEGCPYCLKMQTEIFNVPKYSQQISRKYLHVSIHQEDSSLPKAFHVKYFPTNLILSPYDLHIIDEFAGYMRPDSFIELLDEVYAQEFKSF
ncbi:MAG: soxW [Proteobacteria bacterium]|nr:soxW [Pseudomonadota bacterium]